MYNYLVELGISLPTFWEGEVTVILIGVILGLVVYIVGSLLSKPNYEKADKFIADAGLFKRIKQEDDESESKVL
jgi:SSS family solute:Na+ symporter